MSKTRPTLFLDGPCGRLEAQFQEPPEGVETRAAAVVCHPHPAHGGTMDNTVVFRTARGLQRAGVATLRFNFRSVGQSEGKHDGKGGEVQDALAALNWLERRQADRPDPLPLWSAGFSFGARTALSLASRESRVKRLLCIALPTRAYDIPGVGSVSQPAHFVFAGNDEFGNLADFQRAVPQLPANYSTVEIANTDHFFRYQTPALESAVFHYAESVFA